MKVDMLDCKNNNTIKSVSAARLVLLLLFNVPLTALADLQHKRGAILTSPEGCPPQSLVSVSRWVQE